MELQKEKIGNGAKIVFETIVVENFPKNDRNQPMDSKTSEKTKDK